MEAIVLCNYRAGVKLPTVTVCFKDLTVSTAVYVGSRALPSTLNSYRNIVEVNLYSTQRSDLWQGVPWSRVADTMRHSQLILMLTK